MGYFYPCSDDPLPGEQKVALCEHIAQMVAAGTAAYVVCWFSACRPAVSVVSQHSERSFVAYGTSHSFGLFVRWRESPGLAKHTLHTNDSLAMQGPLSRVKSLTESLLWSFLRTRKSSNAGSAACGRSLAAAAQVQDLKGRHTGLNAPVEQVKVFTLPTLSLPELLKLGQANGNPGIILAPGSCSGCPDSACSKVANTLEPPEPCSHPCPPTWPPVDSATLHTSGDVVVKDFLSSAENLRRT
ncbi:hypothetical protein CB1_001095004 [Camelus ferus]|nr:hypothetical protein CB1_001095004 [Camelus ferus]